MSMATEDWRHRQSIKYTKPTQLTKTYVSWWVAAPRCSMWLQNATLHHTARQFIANYKIKAAPATKAAAPMAMGLAPAFSSGMSKLLVMLAQAILVVLCK